MTEWQKAVKTLLTALLPTCSYHSDRLATKIQWHIHYCDECAVSRSQPEGLAIDEYPYADSVRKLESDE